MAVFWLIFFPVDPHFLRIRIEEAKILRILSTVVQSLFMCRPRDIKQFVLDEADEMLSRGFKDQIYDVFRHLNSEIQVLKTFSESPRMLNSGIVAATVFLEFPAYV